jgi:hypothetical protein
MSASNVHLVLNSRDATNVGSILPLRPPPYQSTTYNALGQNIIQGQVEKVSLNEVNFPYDIPNVQAGFNTFTILSAAYPNGEMVITIPPGFYDGTQLATAINAEIASAFPTAIVPVSDLPAVFFDATNLLFSFEAPQTPTLPPAGDCLLSSSFTYSVGLVAGFIQYGRDLLSIMGFKNYQGFQLPGRFTTAVSLTSTAAPLTFTSYIDICSPELCQFQELKTGNTTNFSRRTDIICRLYVSNNISVNDAGYAPFIINRQFTNERMMRWTADNSIGNMTIQLYDDLGQPLVYTWLPRPFQITFNVYERERSIGSSSALRMN